MSTMLSSERNWKQISAGVLTFAGLMFLIGLAWKQRDEVGQVILGLDPAGSVVAMSLLIACNAVAALLFSRLVADSENNLRRLALAGVFLFSQVAKYVPGRVWSVVVQGLVLGTSLPLRNVLIANIETTLIMLAVVAGVGVALATWTLVGLWFSVGVMAILWVSLLTLIRTGALVIAARFVQQRLPARFHSQQVRGLLTKHRRSRAVATLLLALLLTYGGGWLALISWGLGFPIHDATRLVALLCLSYVLGLLSLLPAGLGAREAAFVALGQILEMSTPTLAAIAVVTRLAMVLIDLASLPIAWMMFYSFKERS